MNTFSYNLKVKEQLSQIVNMLLLNGTLTESPGIVHGKMGIAIFFFHYAQYTENMLFADYALDLIGEIQNQIHVNSPADYEDGIAGIGVGIDYLIRYNFLNVEDDICEDFDQRMFRAVMYDPWQDFSMYDGLTGYGKYWISRLRFQKPAKQAQECLMQIIERIKEYYPNIPLEEQADVYSFVYDLQKTPNLVKYPRLLENCQKWKLLSANTNWNFPRLRNSTVGNTIRMYQHCYYCSFDTLGEADITLKQIPELDKGKAPTNMGLLTGYAGEGLLRLSILDSRSYQWMQLL